MTRVTIAVQPRPYDAWFESGLLARAGTLLRDVVPEKKRLFVITVPPVQKKWGKKLEKTLKGAEFEVVFFSIPPGESSKKLATIERLGERLAKAGADRNSAVIAFGGGVVGDVAGLLGSLYMRGVDVVQVPTTVVAQVDASVGGKTGVNLRTGKNLLGTFHQPRAVLIDPDVLSSLPEREYRSGLYEALKCGVIGKPALFHLFEENKSQVLRRDPAALERLILDSVELKAAIVSADVRENGLRRVLNLGHTIGHALEGETGYRSLLHGEAVAWGMIAATNIALSTGRTDNVTAGRITDAILGLGHLPRVNVASRKILGRLKNDKKTRNGVVHFILPREVGKVDVVEDVPEELVIASVDEIRRLSKA